MSAQKQLQLKRSPSLQQHSSYLLDKHKLDEKLPIILPTIITHKNTYFSLSEQFRHTKKIDAIQKLQYVISFNPSQEFTLLKEFLNKIGIVDEKYHQSKYLAKLSLFIQNYYDIDPNKSLHEIIMKVLKKEDVDQAFSSPLTTSPKKKSIVFNASNKEMLYISPLKLNQHKKGKCARLRASHSQKVIKNHKLFFKRDMYALINLNRQTRMTSKNTKGLLNNKCQEDSMTEINQADAEDASGCVDDKFVPIEEKMQFGSEPIKHINSNENTTMLYNDSFCLDAKKFLRFSRKIEVNFNKGKEGTKQPEGVVESSKKSNDALIFKSLQLNLHQNLNDFKVFPALQGDYYTPRGIDSVIQRMASNDFNKHESVKKKLNEYISYGKQSTVLMKCRVKQ